MIFLYDNVQARRPTGRGTKSVRWVCAPRLYTVAVAPVFVYERDRALGREREESGDGDGK